MCKQPDESLIGICEHHITKGFFSHGRMWTQHNLRVPLYVIYMISKGSYWQIFNIIKKIWIHGFPLFWSINSTCSFELLLATLLQTLNGKPRCWNRCCLWPPLAHQEIFCNKPRLLLSSSYAHWTLCAKLLSTPSTPWEKLQTFT